MIRGAFAAILAGALSGIAMGQGDEPRSASSAGDEAAERERRLDEREARLDALETRLRALIDDARQAVPGSERESDAPPRATPAEVMESHPDAGYGRGEESLADPDFLKSVPLFGSDWRFSFGGYAKVDLLHDFDGVGDPNQFVLGQIPVDGDPQEGSYTTLQAKETRFNFEVRDTAPSVKSRFFVEFDFFDQERPTSTRLRHAYFEHGNLLAGRNWTTLTELRQLPLLLDFAAGDSLYGNRTEQVRYQSDAGENYNWAIALENYDSSAILNSSPSAGTARSEFPRIASRIGYESDVAAVMVGLSLSQVRWDGAEGAGDESELGWSVVTGGRIYLDLESGDYIGFGASLGNGEVTNILTFANAGVPNAVLAGNGDLELISSWHATLGLHKVWTPRWSSNFSLAYAELDPVPGLSNDTIEAGGSVHANVILQLNERMRAGLEYMHGTKAAVSGSDGSANRIQASIFYYF